MVKPMPSQTPPENRPPPATIAEVIQHLTQNEYRFTDKERDSKVITIPKKRGEGNHQRSFNKRIADEIKVVCTGRNDLDRFIKAFEGISWRKAGPGGAGRKPVDPKAYVSKLEKEGVRSNSAGFLSINVAKIFGISGFTKSGTDSNGEDIEITEFFHHKFSVSISGKSITLTDKGKSTAWNE